MNDLKLIKKASGVIKKLNEPPRLGIRNVLNNTRNNQINQDSVGMVKV